MEPSSFKIRFASQTDVGIRRSHNQDAFATQPATEPSVWQKVGHVFIVADGMGGHAVGEKASAKAVRDIPLTFTKHVPTEGPVAAIRRAFTEANAGIFQIGQNTPEFRGLGTTGTALFLRPEGAWIGHVGDSRVYRIRGGKIEQLTYDHSWVWELARRKGVDPDELEDVRKNVIVRSLGPEAEVEVDIEGPHPLEPNDTFLICSDGLTNHVKPDEIGAVVSIMQPAEACNFLIELANLRGGTDNITVLIVKVASESGSLTTAVPKLRKPNAIVELVRWWGRRISWPITGILAGALLLALSIWFRVEQIPGAVFLFLCAALLMLPGLVFFILQLKRKVDVGSEDDNETPPLKIHKQYQFTLDRALFERFTKDHAGAKKRTEEDATVTVDAQSHAVATTNADGAASKGDWPTAILAQAQAIQLLAAPLNKNQHKAEAFRPNWTSAHKLG